MVVEGGGCWWWVCGGWFRVVCLHEVQESFDATTRLTLAAKRIMTELSQISSSSLTESMVGRASALCKAMVEPGMAIEDGARGCGGGDGGACGGRWWWWWFVVGGCGCCGGDGGARLVVLVGMWLVVMVVLMAVVEGGG